ncbi:unnamed protein product [Pleuronectes platessa]|uniref:Uncharacterized protein n=1 Tax=Pleuronectes platessa TaxID=8262 RepID=A0A9N7U646_PLEPL|nr:unnamed protein product [Pleuronectes platessa]
MTSEQEQFSLSTSSKLLRHVTLSNRTVFPAAAKATSKHCLDLFTGAGRFWYRAASAAEKGNRRFPETPRASSGRRSEEQRRGEIVFGKHVKREQETRAAPSALRRGPCEEHQPANKNSDPRKKLSEETTMCSSRSTLKNSTA